MRTVLLDEGLRRTDAPNGLVVVTERLPGVRSAAAGIWVRTASGHETSAKMGVSHLLEHMVFKGAGDMGAREIVERIEAEGGTINASTGYERTSFEVRGLDGSLPLAMQVLSDLVFRPTLEEFLAELRPKDNWMDDL